MKTIDNKLQLVECPIEECKHCKKGFCQKKKINMKCNVCIDNSIYIEEVKALQELISKDIVNYKFRKEKAVNEFAKHKGLEVRFNKAISSLIDLNSFLDVLIEKE